MVIVNKTEAKKKIIAYLKERNIQYFEHVHVGGSCIVVLLTGYSQCPDSALEVSFDFFDNGMECRVYYTESGSGWIKERADDLSDLYRLMNFINARVWPATPDGYGVFHHLYTPRVYITEDGNYDITAATAIDYDHYELAALETEDYCTAAIPELMAKLSTPIFFVLLKEMTVRDAIAYIKEVILQETIE